MEKFSNQVALELGINSPCINLSSEMDRYALFKIGPVLVASVSQTACKLNLDLTI